MTTSNGPGTRQSVQIRRAGAADWNTVRDARLAALAAEPECFGTSLEQDQRMAEQDWTASLSNNQWLLAHRGRELVGVVAFFPADTSPDGLPQLGAMWVSPAARRSGVAAALEQAVARLARADGFRGLGLWVTSGNSSAEAVYRAIGYRRSEDVKPAPRDPAVPMNRMVRFFET